MSYPLAYVLIVAMFCYVTHKAYKTKNAESENKSHHGAYL